MSTPRTQEVARATAGRWMFVCMTTVVVYIAVILYAAKSDSLRASTVIPILVAHTLILALAAWLAAGLRRGKRAGGAAVLAGFYVLFAIGPSVAGLLGGLDVDHPTLLLVTGWILLPVAVRTLMTAWSVRRQEREVAPR